LHYALKRLHEAIDTAETKGPPDDRSGWSSGCAWYEAEIGPTEAVGRSAGASPSGDHPGTAAPSGRPLHAARGRRPVVVGVPGRRLRLVRVTPVITPAPSLAAVAPGSPSPTETRPDAGTDREPPTATIAFIPR
jgi:hypothetical protein